MRRLSIATTLSLAVLIVSTVAAAPIKLHPSGTHTGIERIDRVLDAVDARDGDALAALVQPFTRPCVAKPDQHIPSRPVCDTREKPGTPVQVFWGGSCEGYFVRLTDASDTLEAWAGNVRGLYAVYRSKPAAQYSAFNPRAGFGVMYAAGKGRSLVAPKLILGPRGRIRAVLSGCSETPAQELARVAGKLVLPPRK